jgi:hypothetical protein
MDILADIADASEALCDPHPHAEPRYEWDANRNRKPIAPHRTVVPGLIQQLRELAEEGTPAADGMGVRSIPESRPPGAFDAVSLLAAISFGAAWRMSGPRDEGGLALAARPDPEGNVRALVGAAPTLDSDLQRDIRHELQSWQRQAEVILGWRQPPIELVAPCPVVDIDGHGTPCGARGTLLADRDGKGARCVKCGAFWDETSVGVLLGHVQAYTDQSRRAAEAARLKVRESKTQERRIADEAKKRRERAA